MRDKLVTLATGNPELIRFEECDVPMLTMDDFEILDSSWNKSCVNGCTFLEDEELQRHLAMMCIETAKLCIPLGRILETVRSPKGNNQGYDTSSSVRGRMILLASDGESQTSGARKEHESLAKWAENLPDGVIYKRPTGESIDKVLAVHAALLQMIYFATVICATKQLPTSHQIHGASSQNAYVAVERARLAAMEITEVAQDLQELNLVRYLPTSGVTPVIMASIVHLQFVKEGRTGIRKSSVTAFHQCMQFMRGLRESYFSADFAVALMTRAARKIDSDCIDASSLQGQELTQSTGSVGTMRPTNNQSQGGTNGPTVKVSQSYLSSQEPRFPSPVSAQNTVSSPSSSHFFELADSQLFHFYPDDMIFEELVNSESLNSIFGNTQYPRSSIPL
jgi:hypothetical protein